MDGKSVIRSPVTRLCSAFVHVSFPEFRSLRDATPHGKSYGDGCGDGLHIPVQIVEANRTRS
jgi:hypothetical protein